MILRNFIVENVEELVQRISTIANAARRKIAIDLIPGVQVLEFVALCSAPKG